MWENKQFIYYHINLITLQEQLLSQKTTDAEVFVERLILTPELSVIWTQ